MRLLVRTKTNSLYRIGTCTKTWERLQSTPTSGHIRGKQYGTFLDISEIEVGKPLSMLLPSFLLDGPSRAIITSDVVAVEEET